MLTSADTLRRFRAGVDAPLFCSQANMIKPLYLAWRWYSSLFDNPGSLTLALSSPRTMVSRRVAKQSFAKFEAMIAFNDLRREVPAAKPDLVLQPCQTR